MNEIFVKNKKYDLPIYLPDATRGVTKSIDSTDLQRVGIRGVVVNTFHLYTNPGLEVLNKFGGVKEFMNFDGFVVSDSGGWQVFSLIHRNKKMGKINDEGVQFNLDGGNKEIFTPEKSIQIQFEIGSDVVTCLDDFTSPKASHSEALASVNRTTAWAKRCVMEYNGQLEKRKLKDSNKPLLMSVIQGGSYKELRKKSANELIELGFDLYGYGGYPIDDDGNLDLDISEYIYNLLPQHKPKFALGLGKPADIVSLQKMGWDIFDCTLPTRDARHKRLYIFNDDPFTGNNILNKNIFSYLYISRSKYAQDTSPISLFCDCPVCKYYSKSYLYHLFRIGDTSALRLATMHNLSIYSSIISALSGLTG